MIQNNVFMNARGPLDSYGVHIDYNNENVVVQYNFSYNNEGGFVQILGSMLMLDIVTTLALQMVTEYKG